MSFTGTRYKTRGDLIIEANNKYDECPRCGKEVDVVDVDITKKWLIFSHEGEGLSRLGEESNLCRVPFNR